ncbi:MAG: chalcone isomerase family protein [Bdellovibrionales bacterium]
MKSIYLTLFGLFISISAQAAVLNMEPSDKKVADVAVIKQAQLLSEDGQKTETTLGIVGAGLRKRFFVQVYVAQMLADRVDLFKRTEAEALNSLMSSQVIGLHMSFLRALSAEDLVNGFISGFARNEVDTEKAGVKEFLATVGGMGDFSPGSSLTLVGDRRAADSEMLIIEAGSQVKRVNVPNGTVGDIMKLLLGNTSGDGGLTDLKQQIINFQP